MYLEEVGTRKQATFEVKVGGDTSASAKKQLRKEEKMWEKYDYISIYSILQLVYIIIYNK